MTQTIFKSLFFLIHLPPEHSNYFGTDDKLGAVAVSIRREKLEDTKDLKDQYQYRLIVRTNEVCADLLVSLAMRDGSCMSVRA